MNTCAVEEDILRKTVPANWRDYIYRPDEDTSTYNEACIVQFKGAQILSRGNITILTGHAGKGKSQGSVEPLCSNLLDIMSDCLGLSLCAKSMLLIDTEKARSSLKKAVDRIKRRASYDLNVRFPKNLRIESIREVDLLEYRLEYLWENIDCDDAPELVILDGVADFVRGINDEAECTEFVYKLLAVASRRNIGIFCTLHTNPAGVGIEKGRGVLGSEIWRKAECALLVKSLGDGVKCITTEHALGKVRDASDQLSQAFRWNDEAKMFLSCESLETKQKGVTASNDSAIIDILQKKQTPISYSDLLECIMGVTGVKERAAKYKVSKLRNSGKIVIGTDLLYTVVDSKNVSISDYIHE